MAGSELQSSAEAGRDDWYVTRQGQQYGPYGREQLWQLAWDGNVGTGDLVWNPQAQGWTEAARIPGLLAGAEPIPAPGKKPPNLFLTALSPGMLIRARLEEHPWPLALVISGLAFALFFLQAGLDLLRVGGISSGTIITLALGGVAYGTAGIGLLGAAAWVLSRLFQGHRSPAWTVRAFGLSFAPTLVYVILGLAANLALGWNTSVAFGVTGVLWAFIPLSAVIHEMVDGRRGVSIVLTTFCGVLLLWSWTWLGLI